MPTIADPKGKTLTLHKKLYEKRIEKIKGRDGLTEQEVVDLVNDPALFRRDGEIETPSSDKEK